jgi:hypothetical protein
MKQVSNIIIESFDYINLPISKANSKGNNQDEKFEPNPLNALKENKKVVQSPIIKDVTNTNYTSVEKATKENNENNTEIALKNERADNLRRKAFYRPMIFLKEFFKEMFGLNFDCFKCEIIFGCSVRYFKVILGWKIYQILCCYKENKLQIMNFLKRKINEDEKLMFFYFMTRTYEELYKHYITGNIDFPIFSDGTLRICKFITLKKAITMTDKKGKNKIKDINKFVELSMNMLDDIKNKEREGGSVSEVPAPKIDIKIFEDMRNQFNEEATPSSIELKE